MLSPALRTVAVFLAIGSRFPPAAVAAAEPSTVDEIHHAIRALADKRYPTAAESARLDQLVEEARLRFPREPVALYWQAYVMDRTPTEAEVARLLEACLAVQGTSTDAVAREVHARAATLLGAIRLAQGKAPEAKALAQRAIELAPAAPAGYRLFVDAAFNLGVSEEAARMLADASQQESAPSPEIREMYFSLLIQMGRWQELEGAVAVALKGEPSDGVAHHFRARALARSDGTDRVAVDHAIAALNGSPRLVSTSLSQEWLARANLDNSRVTGLVGAYDLVMRCEARMARGLEHDSDEIRQAGDLLRKLTPRDADEQLVTSHLQATLAMVHGDVETARRLWEVIEREWPHFVPALCRLAQILEIDSDAKQNARARELVARAKRACPTHPLVREFDQLGLRLALGDADVVVEDINAASPLVDVGVQKGDRILAADGVELATLPAMERLRRIRFFSGGVLRLVSPAGQKRDVEVPILLFE